MIKPQNEMSELLTSDVENILLELTKFAADPFGDFEAFLRSFVTEFMSFLFSAEELLEKQRIRSFAKKIFGYQELNLILLQQFTNQMKKQVVDDENVKWKLVNFFVALPPIPNNPNANFAKLVVGRSDEMDVNRHRIYVQKVWLELLKIQLSPKMYRLLLPHFVEKVMDHLPNSELFVDSLYRIFKIGNLMAVISLAGIFKLIVSQNLEHQNFYADVYRIMQPNICYSNYCQKFFDLIDIVLSSSHVPAYIVCAFVKKLSRILLFAPSHRSLSILQLIKNLLCRHPNLHSLLIDRENPQTLERDPYDEEETDLQKCRAMDSSLWELKALQNHWHSKISTRANFVNGNTQDNEMSLDWKASDAFFESIFGKAQLGRMGTPKVEVGEETEENNEEGTEEEEEDVNGMEGPERKRRKEDEGREERRSGRRKEEDEHLYIFGTNSPWTF